MNRPSFAMAGLTACSGCQLTLFNCESELPEIADRFSLDFFPMGISRALLSGSSAKAVAARWQRPTLPRK